ncbi:sugar phosphate nucleotidyltransferase [Shouchella patagoniensis]|uniref:sugar phosphate nucleotidyltransferase n=1 Tax=Shouchella patagoniensis TaxID=228576 RepID=UPI0009950AFD|nr:sugar phosphate nucleotidyltransferase [Shouchella patagoniensis]
MSNSIAAFLLAGGKGTRLGTLTKHTAKPAVPFAGRYRLIDFTLTNLARSAIKQVTILTQYESPTLHRYVKNGEAWNLTATCALSSTGGYAGTADAVYQKLQRAKNHDYVLIVSGDHIYEMDYQRMLKAHIHSNADVTIALTEVTKKEATRFGIAELNSSGKIMKFIEKPLLPKSQLASMGIYLFSRPYLEDILKEDALNPLSSHDFGKDIIPQMIEKKASVYGYQFKGYWRDVGTVESYFSAHMDKWNVPESPFFSTRCAVISEFAIPVVDLFIQNRHSRSQRITHSVIDPSATLGNHLSLSKSLLLGNARIGHFVSLHQIIVPPGAHIPDNTTIICSRPTIFQPTMLSQSNVVTSLHKGAL